MAPLGNIGQEVFSIYLSSQVGWVWRRTWLGWVKTFLCLRHTKMSYCSVNSWGELERDFLKVHLPNWGWGRFSFSFAMITVHLSHREQLRVRQRCVWFSLQETFTTGIKWQHEPAPSTFSCHTAVANKMELYIHWTELQTEKPHNFFFFSFCIEKSSKVKVSVII